MPEVALAERSAEPQATAPDTMTYEEFLAWADEDTWAEWVDGEVIEMSPATDPHQDVSIFLATVLNTFTQSRGLGEVRAAPFQMKTGPELPGREPDLLFVARDHDDRRKRTHLEGPADLAVEIISVDSRGRDRGDKFYEYEQGGVREYWLIDPERRQAEFYQLDEDGYLRLVSPDDSGVYNSAVLLGLWLRIEWLWPESRPTPLDVFREWGLI